MKKLVLFYTLVGVLLLTGNLASAQGPGVSGLSMDASSPDYSTNDELTASYTLSNAVESTTAWYRNAVPIAQVSYPFEAGATNALLDYSGRHYDLSTSGDPATTPVWGSSVGLNGTGAFTFDGNDYLDAGTRFPRNEDYSKTAWIYLTGNGYMNIISGYNNDDLNHSLKVNPNGRLNAGHSFGTYYVIDTDSLHYDTWYFVALTFDYETGLMILYRDGVEVDRDIVPPSNRSISDDGLLIGAKNYNFFWQGVIDEPTVWRRALSPEQVMALYTSGGDLMVHQETRGGEQWRIRVTPFSETEVGSSRTTTNQTLQAATVSGLSVTASSPDNLTTDDLTASFTSNGSVIETATAWFRDGNPDALLYLPFEGIEENLNDYSGSGNHANKLGTLTQDPMWDETGGHDGTGGYIFDGTDVLEAGDIFPLNSDYTKTAWIYNTDIFFGNIMSSNLHDVNNHTLRVSTDGHITAGHDFGNATVRDPDAISLDTWYFVAVSYDYDTRVMRLYRDGLLVHQAVVDALYQDVVDPAVQIGAMNYLYNWTGHIDEPRLYDRVLTSSQIFAMYNGNNEMVAEETIGGEEWHAEVTPFSHTEAGATVVSNALLVHSVDVSDIPDQSTTEGTPFGSIDLDDYVTVYEFTPADLVWTASGNTELTVAIDAVSHVVTVTIPDADWYGSENITFVATNPNGDADSTEVAYTVSNVNDAPVLTNIGGQITDEDVPLTGLVVDFTDPDPTDTHTITVISSDPNVVPTTPTGNTSGSTYDLVPSADWHGSTQITVTVTDDGTGNLEDFETYTLVVDPVNDAPVLTEVGDQSTDEDTNLTGITVIFTDADASDQHTINVVTDDANVSVENLSGNINGSSYDLVPAADWNGTTQVTVTVTDNGTGALSDFESYTLTVNPVNDAPVLTETGDQSTDEDTNLTGLSVVFSDPDAPDAHTIDIVSSDANVSVANLSGNISGSTYDLTLAQNWNGTAQITVTVTDNGTGTLSDVETYTLTVNAVDDPPTIAEIGDQNVDEDGALQGVPVNFTDPEITDTHTITVVSDDANVVVANLSGNASGSTYSLVPAADWNGTAQITVTVTEDGSALLDTEVYTLTVNPVNDAPDTIVLSNNMVDERVPVATAVGVFSTTDVDVGDTHVYTFVTDGGVYDVDNGAFVIVDDTLKTNAEVDFEVQDSYSILVQSDDGQGGTKILNFVIHVNDVDETAVEDFYNSPAFNVYPVPAVDYVTVEIDNPESRELLLEIYYATGAVVHSEKIFDKKRVDVSGFKDGMYIVRISGEKVYGTRKLIVKDR